MTFDHFLLHAVRNRPARRDWQHYLWYAATGLTGESIALLETFRGWPAHTPYPLTSELRAQLTRLEFYRALVYYQLDLRPCSTPVTWRASGLDEAAEGLVTLAGKIALAVRDWLSHKDMLDPGLTTVLWHYDAYRACIFDSVGLTPERLWQDEMQATEFDCRVQSETGGTHSGGTPLDLASLPQDRLSAHRGVERQESVLREARSLHGA